MRHTPPCTITHTHTPCTHARTLRYETTNHLWLILEYCVGGDLMSLLRQDVRLPESSVHDFGRDLVVALQVCVCVCVCCVRGLGLWQHSTIDL